MLYDNHLVDGGLQEHVQVLGVTIPVNWTPVMSPRVSVILVTCYPMMEPHA